MRTPLPFRRWKQDLDLLRAFRQLPENRAVSLASMVTPRLATIPEHIPGARRLDQSIRSRVLVADLQRLNDLLARSPIADRYWLWGGALLGWAREGAILRHDQKDVDFAYEADDDERLAATIEFVAHHGFHRWFSFRSNTGVITERAVTRHGATFEFFRVTRVGAEWEYRVYGNVGGHLAEIAKRIPIQPLEEFHFLGRSWRKVEDHERELTALYGDWRTPDPSWDYMDMDAGDMSRWTGGSPR